MKQANFNSRPSARGDRTVASTRKRLRNFNSRPSARGDQTVMDALNTAIFQFTPLREGRHNECVNLCFVMTFQFTPLREGRRAGRLLSTGRPDAISIHAPPRGATGAAARIKAVNLIFQFTPLREGRPSRMAGASLPTRFQFTPLREGRQCRAARPVAVAISIHAPPRGATCGAYEKEENLIFQFTPLREGRHDQVDVGADVALFQFTPLREGRLGLMSAMEQSLTFQFTPLREGRRS